MEWQSMSTAMPKRLRVRFQQLGQGPMEGPVKLLDALEGGADGQPLAVDFLGVGYNAGDGAQAPYDPG